MDKNNQLDSAYSFCILLKNDAIKKEIENCLTGYSLDDIKFKNGQFKCTFSDKFKNTISLFLRPRMIHLIKYNNNILSSINIMEDQVLRQSNIEKRNNGIIYTEIQKQFSTSSYFKNQNVLVDLWENRYVFSRENINKIISKSDYENVTLMYILLKLKSTSLKSKLDDICDIYNSFSTHMNYYSSWVGGRKIKDNIYPTRTYLNNEEVSSIFDVNDGPDKLYRVYDLYLGIINSRNEFDINLINLGFLSPDAFDFKSLMGITEKENNLVGKSQSSVSSNYINYLTQFFNNKFGYKGKISLDRESLISAITYHKTESELEKRQTESKLTISYEEYENLDVKGQHKLNNKITKNGPKRILKRIFRRK